MHAASCVPNPTYPTRPADAPPISGGFRWCAEMERLLPALPAQM
jgi:hypothetical protein